MNKQLLTENMKKIKELQEQNNHLLLVIEVKEKQIRKLVKDNLTLKTTLSKRF